MKSLVAAVSFLTRFPCPRGLVFNAEDIARASTWFPVVGALLGLLYWGVAWLLAGHFPVFVIAILIVGTEVLATGALHLDAVADMADGFGGGQTREDVLRIMRDHAVGSYGVAALILLIVLKAACIAVLLDHHKAGAWLVTASALGRWCTALLNTFLPYARRSPQEGARRGGSVTEFVRPSQLAVASLFALVISAASVRWSSIVGWAVALLVSAYFAWLCRRRIGGVTGDTLGACAETSETLILLAAIFVR
jgi:adenosylcobinamide-GDP ribazoletransferase